MRTTALLLFLAACAADEPAPTPAESDKVEFGLSAGPDGASVEVKSEKTDADVEINAKSK
ncbi:MAG: hypothetical protein EP330_23895 [Deltaproteobacteria bacterium]|nr:MAG: hypothetical protein EP330_23895 [Deltaproteobacteria bacterium]